MFCRSLFVLSSFFFWPFTFFHKLLILFHKESYVKQEKFEDTKGIIRICKSKDRQHNGQKKKDERTNNDLQNITQKTKDRVTQTPLKHGVNSGAPEGLAVPAPLVTPVVLI
jgi:hypothetical protein